MSDSRPGFAETDPGLPGAGPVPGALAATARGPPAGKVSRIHHGPGRLAVTPAARAGSRLTTSQDHHDGRAAWAGDAGRPS